MIKIIKTNLNLKEIIGCMDEKSTAALLDYIREKYNPNKKQHENQLDYIEIGKVKNKWDLYYTIETKKGKVARTKRR